MECNNRAVTEIEFNKRINTVNALQSSDNVLTFSTAQQVMS